MWEFAERISKEFFPGCEFTILPSRIVKQRHYANCDWVINRCRVDCGNVIFEVEFFDSKMFYRVVRSCYRFNKL